MIPLQFFFRQVTKFFPRDILAKNFSGEIMDKKYLYFQQQYVSQFQCDGSKCDAHCCQGWNIFIDAKTFEQYPPEIKSRMKFSSERGEYLMELDEGRRCPFLNEKNLCSIQLKYGEKFLSQTCATYPRVTNNFGDFYERALTLSCPLAAELALFGQEQMRFEFVNVPEKIHSNGGKIRTSELKISPALAARVFEIQGAMITILQERRLTLNQRLIVSGLFLDTLQERLHDKISVRDLRQLINAYDPKIFLRNGIPPVIEKIPFDAKKFVALMLEIFEPLYKDSRKFSAEGRRYFDAVVATLKINGTATLAEVVDAYARRADERKIFRTHYEIFLENFLVNELFINVYPWRLTESITKNFAVFLTTYKVFELIIFSAASKGLSRRADLIGLVGWFTRKIDHGKDLREKILAHFDGEDDMLNLLETLIEH